MRIARNLIPDLKIHALPLPFRLSLDISWLIVVPVGIWAVATMYVPIMGDLPNKAAVWLVALIVAIMAAVSLLVHLLAHQLTFRWAHSEFPPVVSLTIFGDAAQSWPTAPSTGREILVLLSGPIANLVLAGLAYLAWNAQISQYINLSTLFICFFNLWVAVLNLTPAFPFDGGRLARTMFHKWSGWSGSGSRLPTWMGFLAISIQAAWGISLIVPGYQYSWETGIATLFLALIFLIYLVKPFEWNDSQPLITSVKLPHPNPFRLLVTSIVIIVLLAAPAGLLMTNYGIDAPGVALSVEPMVQVPPQYQHKVSGTFILTSVLSQTPIPLIGWVIGNLDPAVALIPPQKYNPGQASPQETAQQGFQMLDESELTAEVVALQLAGYPAKMVGEGASVDSVLSDSPSRGIFLPGDVIIAVDGTIVQTASSLVNLIQGKSDQQNVVLKVVRGGETLQLTVPLIPPTTPTGSPKLGITVQTAGFTYQLPINVKITPQKIVGGPSAGLMFTLTLYNLLTPDDLTDGYRIAGTGTINPDGTVGPIGGVKQKVVAAEDAGARYFLAPVQDYPDALSVAHQIKVVEIANVQQAIQFLQSLPAK